MSSLISSLRIGHYQCMRTLCSAVPQTKFLQVSEPIANVVHVELNRPEIGNAFNIDLWREIKLVFEHLATYSQCRSVVLSGAGKSFSVGLDLKSGVAELLQILESKELDVARKSWRLQKSIQLCQESFSALEKCPKPVIAAVHSHCIGAAINLITSADVRYASSDTNFSIREVKVGIIADVGVLNRINKLVGNDSFVREYALTGRDFGSAEALKLGLISRIFPDKKSCLEGSLALASEIAANSPIAVQGTKLTLNYARDHSVEDSLTFVRLMNQSQLQNEDMMKAASAVLSKKQVEFRDV
ncbi:hypothetical protein AB6A40_004359 [Gnathostoma spinigerum]|uniref:Delta(3,5)-Delta(2,4)-dienoyl-CoA isomerase, mitochondrial n=1 Tax=Gnathostoma spinigerum TaxID=75299 RepID=A0ABD6EDD0_9BILA